MKKLLIFIALLALGACGVKQNVAPDWINGKPIDPTGTLVYGLGMSYVNPNTAYQQAARSNALADLAQEVESQIYDETKILQKEDIGGMNTAFSSQTLTTTHVKLEDYQIVDAYADGYRYYVLYKLDLPQYLTKKEAGDQASMKWIKEKLEMARDGERELDGRLSLLGSAVHEAIERNFLVDPKYKVEVKTQLVSALRNIESDLGGAFLIPESVFYLGMPDQFSAAFKMNNNVIAQGLKLTTTSGSFEYHARDGAIISHKTGKDNAIKLSMELDFAKILPQLDDLSVAWLKGMTGWTRSESIYFQNATVQIQSDEALTSTIANAVAKTFTVQDEAPLTLVFNGGLHEADQSRERSKCSIEGQFVLKNTSSGQVIWSSQTIESSALSADKQAANRAAKNDFTDNIAFFVLPQLERNLGF